MKGTSNGGGMTYSQSIHIYFKNYFPGMAKCTEFCRQNTCAPDTDTRVGCNQMFNCPQACKMRDLGLSRSECEQKCQRNGGSGCNPTVKGWTFRLCRDCNRNNPSCTTWPTVEECKKGCNAYQEDNSHLTSKLKTSGTIIEYQAKLRQIKSSKFLYDVDSKIRCSREGKNDITSWAKLTACWMEFEVNCD